MRLTDFRILNFRSINDSGWISVNDRTALVGRNESGKTNLLLALSSLNPPGERPPLDKVKDFPRDRPFDDFDPTIRVVKTKWSLSEAEQGKLRALYPHEDIEEVTVNRDYGGKLYIGLGLEQPDAPPESVDDQLSKLERSVNASLRFVADPNKESVKAALEKLRDNLLRQHPPKVWAERARSALEAFDSAAQSAGLSLSESGQELRSALDSEVSKMESISDQERAARAWVSKRLPTLVYVDDYPALSGHQDIEQYLERKNAGQLEPSDREFEKLLKVAGLDAEELNKLLKGDNHEARQQMANRAGAVLTNKIRELWTDRRLKVRFGLDAQHFDTIISDSAAVYDVEVNLDERSLGFRWFFSFYISFAAETQGGAKDEAVILLDEPGLHLHAVAQRDLLTHFEEDFSNQILYTTHSPFMIPVRDIASVRTVNITLEEGTTVTNDPKGDSKTLFPLQTALGYTLTQTLFVGPANLIVEGVTDYWYLSAVSEYFDDIGDEALPDDLAITPAGSAQKVPYMVSLLSSQEMDVLVLMDGEAAARRTAKDDLIRPKLIRDNYVLFADEAFDDQTTEADIEDLIDPEVFTTLVDESYADQLAGVELELNPMIPRLVKRYEEAFADAGLTFHKTRPARLFLAKMGSDPGAVMTDGTKERFSKLFELIRVRREKQNSLGRGAYR